MANTVKETPDLITKLKAVWNFCYVASPYSKHPRGMDEAHREVCQASAWLVRQGVKVFCPIAHTHWVARYGEIPLEAHDIWLPADQPFINLASAIVVVMLDSWKESFGVKYEVDQFVEAGKPVFHLSWPREW